MAEPTTEQLTGTFSGDWSAAYDVVFGKIKATLDTEYEADKIVGDKYALVVAQSIQMAINAATELAKQEILLDEQEELIQKQIAKLVADTSFVTAQEEELRASVIFNNKIKALDSMGEMIGTMGAGGLVISTDMWSFYFLMIRELISTRKDFISTWNASTNTPNISLTTPSAGDFYVVTVAGATSLEGINSWSVGDIAYFDGFAWRKDLSSPSSTAVTKPA